MVSSASNNRKARKRLGLRDCRLLARCLISVAASRIALSTIGYRRLPPPRRCGDAPAPPHLVARVRSGVAWASRYVPHATCLTQAVACRYLLARQGYATTLRIGVRRDKDQTFAAHAWLLNGEEVVIGGDSAELQTYARLADFQTGAR